MKTIKRREIWSLDYDSSIHVDGTRNNNRDRRNPSATVLFRVYLAFPHCTHQRPHDSIRTRFLRRALLQTEVDVSSGINYCNTKVRAPKVGSTNKIARLFRHQFVI